MSVNENRIWSTFGSVVTVTPEAADVMGAAVTLTSESDVGSYSTALTLDEALLLAEMLVSSVREVVREVIS